MSRLIVRGLPSYLTDVRLGEHFSQKGTVTDVKLMRRPDGTSRKFGFVGYRSEEEAQQALDYFNRTFIDTCRITVEFAKKIGDEELAKQRQERSNRRNAELLGQQEVRQGKKRKFDPPQGKDDGGKKKKKRDAISFDEFMSVMQPKAKRKAWQNEDALPQQTMQDITAPVDKLENKAEKKAAKKKKAAQAAAQPQPQAQAQAQASASTGKTEEEAEAEAEEPDTVANDVGLTDEEYMRLRMKHKVGTDLDTLDATTTAAGPQFEQSDDEQDLDQADSTVSDSSDEEEIKDEELEQTQAAQRRKAEESAAKEQKIVDQIMESGRLFVRNLPFAASEEEIQGFFESFGTVKQVS